MGTQFDKKDEEFSEDIPQYLKVMRELIGNLCRYRKDVSEAIHVSPDTISNWLVGNSVPSPEIFYHLVSHLATVTPNRDPSMDEAIKNFYLIAHKPIGDVAGKMVDHFGSYKSLSDYYSSPDSNGHNYIVSVLPPRLKAAYLQKVCALSNELLERHCLQGESEEVLMDFLKELFRGIGK